MRASTLTAALLLAAPLAAQDNGIPPGHKGADLSFGKARDVNAWGAQGTGGDIIVWPVDGKPIEVVTYAFQKTRSLKAAGAQLPGIIVDPPPAVPIRVRDVQEIDLQWHLLADLAKVRPLNAADMQGVILAMPQKGGLQYHPDHPPLGPPTHVWEVEELWERALDGVLDHLLDQLAQRADFSHELYYALRDALERRAAVAHDYEASRTDLAQLLDMLEDLKAAGEAQGSPLPDGGVGAQRHFVVEVERARMRRAKALTERRFAAGEPIDLEFRLRIATQRARLARAIGFTR